MNREGFANLYPTIIKIAAKHARGILFKSDGIRKAVKSSKIPWEMEDAFVRAPAATLAELLTITAVIGNPPISPLTILPSPCALSSWLSGDVRLNGSSLSTASILNKLSKLATMAIVNATVHVESVMIAEKSGKANCSIKDGNPSDTGNETKCSGPTKNAGKFWNIILSSTPIATTSKGAGTNVENFES